jgi:ribulose-5-phosphate 4-epimerase/fuculose-1-phosphate aldolase
LIAGSRVFEEGLPMLETSGAEHGVTVACSPEEWQVRVDLAAAYRLVAHYGWDDLIFTHLSARVPGPEDHFLINPFGLLFEEITASSLVKIDVDGAIVQDTPYEVNHAGFVIHSAIHMSRDDARCVMHLHTPANIAVASMEDGLLPLHQSALSLIDEVRYHDFEGPANELDERERLQADLGDRSLLLLRNHGSLAVGPSVAVAFVRANRLERACEIQMRMLSAGRPLCVPSQKAVDATSGIMRSTFAIDIAQEKIWPAMLRMLDRRGASFRD